MKKTTRAGEKQTLFLRWIKPPLGYFKLNVDGSRDVNAIIGAGESLETALVIGFKVSPIILELGKSSKLKFGAFMLV